jgi:hypothetical protein
MNDLVPKKTDPAPTTPSSSAPLPAPPPKPGVETEVGGPKGPEPTRYGDWQFNGRCTDF